MWFGNELSSLAEVSLYFWHLFNNSNTNEDIAAKCEQEYVRCVRNEEECVCSAPNCCSILISGKIIKEMPGSVASGTHCINIIQGTLLP